MITILLVGQDESLLEGVSQTLMAAGHTVVSSHSVAAGVEALQQRPALVAVVEHELLLSESAARIPLAPGGGILVFHVAEHGAIPLPPRLRRLTIAELELPLERNRLVSLVKHVEGRAQSVGRDDPDVRPGVSSPEA
jgi:DNA-binding NtrC family response regulator